MGVDGKGLSCKSSPTGAARIAQSSRALYDTKLKRLVANPIPADAVPINLMRTRFRIQVDVLSVGYEYDKVQDVVLVKAILFDEDGSAAGDKTIQRLLGTILGGR